MEEIEDNSIESIQYKEYKDSVLKILGMGGRKDKLDPTMDTTIEELRKLWNTEYPYSIDDIHSGSIVGSIDPNSIRTPRSSDEPPQPNPSLLTIDGLHKIEGRYRKGNITDTLHNNRYYIIELHIHSRVNHPIEATIHREPLEDSKIRIDIREYGRASVRYHTQREGFRNRKGFAEELFALAEDYIEGEYYK